MDYLKMTKEELKAEQAKLYARFREFRSNNYNFSFTRGKPSKQQLDLTKGMFDVLSSNADFTDSASGEDCRNYGLQDGLLDTKKFFGTLLDLPYDSIVIGNNSSLSLEFDVISKSPASNRV